MRTSTISVLLICSIAFFSCNEKEPDAIVKGQAKIKVVNAIQGDTKQNVYLDNEKVTNNALSFGETSEYIKILSGSRTLTFTDTNNLNTNTNFNFVPALTYSTFLVSDRNGNREILNYEDNLSTSDMASAKIRFINLTPYFTTGVNVSIQTGSPFVNALLFKESSNYYTLEAGADLKYNVVGSGNIKTILASELSPGKIYSVWFSGLTSANLQAHLIVDN
ncbi:DUF4397 domain-containing protein [Pedobacter sp. Leaf176]|uniref:DUF4397 domain-containing protein n=1 Tax=Pedobacter sp. Leaf176 TaxID=1736286 RepID=UPI0006F4E999|nr:DUF4397 domain-containing protein [Pedobacter sp. Leaf176]KQR70546.1 hypothetical protein ASF92_11305 [Pedobacter sp. Leaf176]